MTDRRPMGALEAQVLDQLWRCPAGATPGEVLEDLGLDLSYTTVMTILTRLWQKGLATREKHGRAFCYRAAISEAELAAQRMAILLGNAKDRRGALSKFVESLSARDARALRSLLEPPERR